MATAAGQITRNGERYENNSRTLRYPERLMPYATFGNCMEQRRSGSIGGERVSGTRTFRERKSFQWIPSIRTRQRIPQRSAALGKPHWRQREITSHLVLPLYGVTSQDLARETTPILVWWESPRSPWRQPDSSSAEFQEGRERGERGDKGRNFKVVVTGV